MKQQNIGQLIKSVSAHTSGLLLHINLQEFSNQLSVLANMTKWIFEHLNVFWTFI